MEHKHVKYVFFQMMFELSYRYDKEVKIGVFLGYDLDEILSAVQGLEVSLYEMRYPSERLNDHHFLKFRCLLFSNSTF